MSLQLRVEGKLDAVILGLFLRSQGCAVVRCGSKTQLAPQVRMLLGERRMGGTTYRYLRDRDFDYNPPEASAQNVPTVDRESSPGRPMGWRWVRHSIENYMLEPAFITQVTGVDEKAYVSALTEAAQRIRAYQAARFAIAATRSRLPSKHSLRTHPENARDRDFCLPGRLDEAAMESWCSEQTARYRATVTPVLDAFSVTDEYRRSLEIFCDDFMSDYRNPIVWFSGKNLMASLANFLEEHGLNPGRLRERVRDHMCEHSDEVAGVLPEWNTLKELTGEVRDA